MGLFGMVEATKTIPRSPYNAFWCHGNKDGYFFTTLPLLLETLLLDPELEAFELEELLCEDDSEEELPE
jgi:hypothetical protein